MVNLLFDYDGTLHDSLKIYAPAFTQAYDYLTARGLVQPRRFTEVEISQWIGLPPQEMWDRFAPDLEQKMKEQCAQIIGVEMLRLVLAGKAVLYPHVTEILEELKSQGFGLFLLSNCRKSYLRTHREILGLDRYFTAFYCGEEFDFAPKHEIFQSVKREYAGEYIIIGDRRQDMDIARKHGTRSVGCLYGYGSSDELTGATVFIHNISQLPQALKQIQQDAP